MKPTPRTNSSTGCAIAVLVIATTLASGPFAAPVHAESAAHPPCQTFATQKPKIRGIPRFAEIEPGLARGGRPRDEGVEYLASRGYRTVIGLRHDPSEAERLRAAGIDYVEIPLRAGLFGSTPPTDDELARFFAVALDSARRPVFFHCRHGKDRTGVLAAVYRMEVCGWTPAEALEEMEALGFSGYHRALRRFVREYEPRGYARRDARAIDTSGP